MESTNINISIISNTILQWSRVKDMKPTFGSGFVASDGLVWTLLTYIINQIGKNMSKAYH